MPVAFDGRIAVGSIHARSATTKRRERARAAGHRRLANTSYKIANLRVGCILKNTHVPLGFWRSLGHSQNAFFMESFIDELAHAAGKDPYQFRRALLAHRPDFVRVLDTLAEKGDWGKPLPAGNGRGIAIHECYGTIVGLIAEVAVRARARSRSSASSSRSIAATWSIRASSRRSSRAA